MKKFVLLLFFSIGLAVCYAQNVGIGTNSPLTKLQVEGSFSVKAPYNSTNTAPTPAQNFTMINASTVTMPTTDSIGRFYDPGGPAGNYLANMTANASVAFDSNPDNYLEIIIESINLGTGDSLKIIVGGIIIYNNGNVTASNILLASPLSTANIEFKSNPDAVTGNGFSILVKKKYLDGNQPQPTAIEGVGLAFFPQKAALRAGRALSNPLGTNSVAVGYLAAATQTNSIAFGQSANATANNTIAIGTYSGASEEEGLAFGNYANANGTGAIAIGNNTTAYGRHATAIGHIANASGDSSVSLGYNNTASGYAATALGNSTTSSGWTSTSMGYHTVASGGSATATGENTNATNRAAFAAGLETTASGFGSTSFGSGTIASGSYSLAAGLQTTAGAYGSTALGWDSRAMGHNSSAIGHNALTEGQYSTAVGYDVISRGSVSLATGMGTVSRAYASTAMGRFNDTLTTENPDNWNAFDRLFTIGNGTANNARSSALVILKNANTDISGYTRLGAVADGAPRIKVKKLTGTTAASQGANVLIPHGLTLSKILSVSIIVETNATSQHPPNYTITAGHEYEYVLVTSSISITNKNANSANILSKPMRILVTYEE